MKVSNTEKHVRKSMTRFWKCILCIALASASILAKAQTDCSHMLVEAERAYYAGRFNQVEGTIKACLSTGFNKEQRVQGYKLIALSSIFLKNFAHADSTLLLMLKTDPQFEFEKQDPPEFRKRVEKFKIHPRVEITANLGLTQPFFHATEVYNSRAINSSTSYKGKVGLHLGMSVGYFVGQRISVRAGYESQRYSLIIEDKNSYTTGELTETQSRSQWHAAAGYNFQIRKLKLQAYGGVIYSTLKKADANLVVQREDESDEVVYFSNMSNRTKNELRPMAELKLNMPAKNNWHFTFSLRFEFGLENLTNSNDRFSDPTSVARFEWVEDDFQGSYLVGTIGISKWLYKVKSR